MNEPTDIDLAMTDFIAQTQKEYSAIPEGDVATPKTESAPVVTEHENTAAVETPNADPAERGLERLVSREVELRERETRLTAKEREFDTLQSRLKELESRAVTDELLNRIRFSPNAGLRELGLDPDEVVKAALVEKLGDKANTPETRDMLERSRLRKEMETLKAQVQSAERQRAAHEYFSRVASGANEFVRNHEGVSKHAPTVASVAKANPDRVYQEIMDEITRDAAVRASQEPNGDIISYEEAAKRVETRWSSLKSLFTPANVSPPVESNASTPTPETKLNVVKDKSAPTTIKPPDKPLAPWLQRSVDDEDAIRLALAEYQRAESKH